jgi:hypothetical protein
VSFTPQSLSRLERAPGTHWIEHPGEPKNLPECSGEGKILDPTVIRTSILQPVASRYIVCALSAQIESGFAEIELHKKKTHFLLLRTNLEWRSVEQSEEEDVLA